LSHISPPNSDILKAENMARPWRNLAPDAKFEGSVAQWTVEVMHKASLQSQASFAAFLSVFINRLSADSFARFLKEVAVHPFAEVLKSRYDYHMFMISASHDEKLSSWLAFIPKDKFPKMSPQDLFDLVKIGKPAAVTQALRLMKGLDVKVPPLATSGLVGVTAVLHWKVRRFQTLAKILQKHGVGPEQKDNLGRSVYSELITRGALKEVAAWQAARQHVAMDESVVRAPVKSVRSRL
jgi:hypothetical protein